jgi:hypothetical protein
MDIFKFSDFIKEDVMITVLDCVIDDRGNIYNWTETSGVGSPQYPLRKGNIVKGKVSGRISVVDIIGSDKRIYIAGIDKNGKLVSPEKNNINGYLVDNNGNRLRVPDYIRGTRSRFWKFYDMQVDEDGNQYPGDPYDYRKLVPIVSTGWVNTKVDMEVVKKVRRYSKGLGQGRGREGFTSKLSDLQRISTSGLQKRKRSRNTIQKEMSVIMLLHYINEIKDFFTPSASGFLFESFLGGMIKDAKIVEDNSKADIRADGETWQIKLYDAVSSSTLAVAYMDSEQAKLEKRDPVIPVDHFVICLKYAEKIEVYVLRGIQDETDPLCFKNFLTPAGLFSVSQIKNCPFKYTIELLGIEEKIEGIASGLKESIDNIYSDLSKFQYNVESIITGVDETGKLLNESKFDTTYNDSVSIAQGLDQKITSLYKTIKREQ